MNNHFTRTALAVAVSGAITCAAQAAPQLASGNTASHVQQNNQDNRMIRIIGGQDAVANTYPWMVSIQSTDGQHFCGGSLVASKYVLTAAHCIENENYANVRVVISEYDLNQQSATEETLSVKNIYMHGEYGNDHDIALLELQSASQKQPVSMATPAVMSSLNAGTNLTVMGWGNMSTSGESFPNILQEVQVPLADHATCKTNYQRQNIEITDNMICAGLPEGGKDSCQGDSGGPLLVQQNSSWIQTGIVSFGEGCALPEYFGVYTKVSNYQDWVAKAQAGELTPFSGEGSNNPTNPDDNGDTPDNNNGGEPDDTEEPDNNNGGEPDSGEPDNGDGVDLPDFEDTELAFELPIYLGFLAAGQGEVVEEGFSLVNTTEQDLTIQGISLDNTTHFKILEENCEGKTLAPEDECDIEVGFSAENSEVHEGVISISTTDSEHPTAEVALFGVALNKLEVTDDFDGIEGIDDEEWYFDGDTEWGEDQQDGGFELACNEVNENEDALLMTEIEGPGTFEFDVNLEGDAPENTIQVLVDGEVVVTISGARAIQRSKHHSVELTEGKHQISWVYRKKAANTAEAKASVNNVNFKSSSAGVSASSGSSDSGSGGSGGGSSDWILLSLLSLLSLGVIKRKKTH